MFIIFQSGKTVPSDNENANNRAAECVAERIEVFKSAFGETEEQLNEEKYVDRLMIKVYSSLKSPKIQII